MDNKDIQEKSCKCEELFIKNVELIQKEFELSFDDHVKIGTLMISMRSLTEVFRLLVQKINCTDRSIDIKLESVEDMVQDFLEANEKEIQKYFNDDD